MDRVGIAEVAMLLIAAAFADPRDEHDRSNGSLNDGKDVRRSGNRWRHQKCAPSPIPGGAGFASGRS